MATAKKPRVNPRVRIVDSDGVLYARRHVMLLRFMFSDGTTLDVMSDRDDSDVREAALAWAEKEAIAGVAEVEP